MANAERTWSTQQQAIFAWFKGAPGDKRNLVVRARAGTGKSTTIHEAIRYAPETRGLLAAFNKKIADELKAKLTNPAFEAKTLHGLGYTFVKRNWERANVERTSGARATQLALRAVGDQAPDAMVALVKRLGVLAREVMPLAQSGAELVDLANDFDIVPDEGWDEEGWTVERIARAAYRTMELAAERTYEIDFADMLFLPLRHRWVRGIYDMVVIDEAQDMNASQLMLARGSCKAGGRVVVVGDDRQAIYGFRGADSDSIDRMKKELDAVELPLNTTYRCPRSVVALAQALVPDYTAAPTAPEGVISSCPMSKLAEQVKPGDFVLSRKNAPLVKVCMQLLRANVRAKVEGRDIGAGLLAIVRKVNARSIPEFLTKITAWQEREIHRAEKSSKDEDAVQARRELIIDQAEMLRTMTDGLSGMRELVTRIETLFDNDVSRGAQVVCSSVHRSKGLEADRVFLLVETLYPSRGGNGKPLDERRATAKLEERNIEYVALTRAKRELTMVI